MAESVIKGHNFATVTQQVTFNTTAGQKNVCSLTLPADGIYIIEGNYKNEFTSSHIVISNISIAGTAVSTSRTVGDSGGGATMMAIIKANVSNICVLQVYDYGTDSGKKGVGTLAYYRLQ